MEPPSRSRSTLEGTARQPPPAPEPELGEWPTLDCPPPMQVTDSHPRPYVNDDSARTSSCTVPGHTAGGTGTEPESHQRPGREGPVRGVCPTPSRIATPEGGSPSLRPGRGEPSRQTLASATVNLRAPLPNDCRAACPPNDCEFGGRCWRCVELERQPRGVRVSCWERPQASRGEGGSRGVTGSRA